MSRIKLAWWEREEERLLQNAPPPSAARDAWLSQLAEAAERQLTLRTDTKPFAPNRRDGAFPAESRGGRRAALLH